MTTTAAVLDITRLRDQAPRPQGCSGIRHSHVCRGAAGDGYSPAIAMSLSMGMRHHLASTLAARTPCGDATMARRARLTRHLPANSRRRAAPAPGGPLGPFRARAGRSRCKLGASNGEPQAIAVMGSMKPAASPASSSRVYRRTRFDGQRSERRDSVTRRAPREAVRGARGRWNRRLDERVAFRRAAARKCRAQLRARRTRW